MKKLPEGGFWSFLMARAGIGQDLHQIHYPRQIEG
jgi:hypothetical protein